ncbi:MAG: pyruvate ferredoxin oxidoreductase [Candidatus Acidulodesulfobacterium acidiphilum]|uniref:Pyruvate ferredoxin oxidoreductase n=1 Tax=Candidatus Acidulodesulfobacterium acidiphilum TaxID=2597224 RepID=A0A520XCA6_9DELT|nr:MAG: pyruvate ferredoxin oxidoreductase [Candidatus Acidulodesulfobacterium acidiphilum]
MLTKEETHNELFTMGHTGCSGCAQSMSVKLIMEILGKNTIATSATGCLEVFSTRWPESSWKIPWIHSLFENSAAVASGIEAALKYMGKKDEITVIAQGGDGGTADIGLQALSGMFERNHDVLYICYDNGAYMNTGYQRSGLTPLDAYTTTSPSGKQSFGNNRPKKYMPEIAMAHRIPYTAVSSAGYPMDLQKKVKKAMAIKGTKYLQVDVPCVPGWKYEPKYSVKLAQLAVQTGLYPLFEAEYDKIISVKKISKKVPVEEYLKLQGRFKHLFKDEAGRAEIEKIQKIADDNIERFGLM